MNDKVIVTHISVYIVTCAANSNFIIVSLQQVFRDTPEMGPFLMEPYSGLIDNRGVEGATFQEFDTHVSAGFSRIRPCDFPNGASRPYFSSIRRSEGEARAFEGGC